MVKFVAYVGSDEVIVTTTDEEKEMLKEYFGEDGECGRGLDDFNREELELEGTGIRIRMNPIVD